MVEEGVTQKSSLVMHDSTGSLSIRHCSLAISRTKSNGDYVRELGFRARERNELRACFGDNVRSFDRAWYGWHEVTREVLEHFRGNHQRISNDGTPR